MSEMVSQPSAMQQALALARELLIELAAGSIGAPEPQQAPAAPNEEPIAPESPLEPPTIVVHREETPMIDDPQPGRPSATERFDAALAKHGGFIPARGWPDAKYAAQAVLDDPNASYDARTRAQNFLNASRYA